MREIVFRGKDIDNKGWVYGALVQQQGHPLGEKTLIISYSNYQHGDFSEAVIHEVDSATVGQYTGLVDKNGNRIFEGDIIKHIVTSDTRWEAIVKWDNDGARFLGLIIGNEPRIMYVGMIDKNNKSVVAVIGNIYDNPELLKDGALNDD